MRLYYDENFASRKVCAAARYLGVELDYVRVELFEGQHRLPAFTAINPNAKVPAFADDSGPLWESIAIMCHLARKAGSDFWPQDDRQINVIRWLMWDANHFGRHASRLFFQRAIRPALLSLAPDEAEVTDAEGYLRQFARVLDDHLAAHPRLVGNDWTVADFAVANPLAWPEAQLPIDDFVHIARWYRDLEALDAWRSPFPAASTPLAKAD